MPASCRHGRLEAWLEACSTVAVYTAEVSRLLTTLWVPVLAGSGLLSGQYVDGRVCAECHGQIAKDYAQTGMGRSFYRPAPVNAVEDYSKNNQFYHPLSDTYYSMVSRDGNYYQRRWQIGFDKNPTNVEELKIDFVLGSGNHARSYLHRTRRGILIELPLGWYAEKGGFWGMSPGFDSPTPATRRLISYECMFCHNGNPRIPAGHDAPGSEPVFTEVPEGIDCQRCHGPGGDHVRTAGREKILNPARLSPKLRMDQCLQCHLEPSSSAIPALVRRFNRGPFSFKPGEALSDFLLAFDHAPGTRSDKFEIVGSSAYRLRQSRCFLESEDAMTCETCHNPHRTVRGEEAIQHYANACRKCHSTKLDGLVSKGTHPASADCATCHMPKRRTDDVVHVVMTDHLIQRRPPSRDLLAEITERHGAAEEYRGEVVPYYPAKLPDADALYRSLAQVLMKNNLGAGVTQFARLVSLQKPGDAEWSVQLGDAWLANGDPAKSVAAYEQAVNLRPNDVRSLQSLAKGLKAAGQNSRSSEVLKQAIEAAPFDARSWYQAAVVDSQSGRTAEAVEKLRNAIALDPDLPGAYTTLAGIQRDRTEPALREALRINPYDAAAWDLAGRALAEKREFPEALYNFEKAIRYRPNFAPYLYDYALTLASASEFDRAQQSAESAIKADPKLPEPYLLLGGLLARKEQLREAAKAYEESLRLRPDFARARLDLASVFVRLGERNRAVEQLREAAKGSDPEVARLATAALEKLGNR